MGTTQMTVQLLPLAQELDENKVTPGLLGFVVFAVLGAAVWMLMKSMNRHMNRVDFEEAPASAAVPRQQADASGATRRGDASA
jgi:hypothetical protein